MFQPQPTRPARFRQTRILIVGCGDVGTRAAKLLRPRCRVMALTSQADKVPQLRAMGLVPLHGNLDAPATLARLAGLASRVLHLAPPPAQGDQDPRTWHLLQALSRRGSVKALAYASTTGVYGHADGAWLDETSHLAPRTARGRRRVDAEARVRWWGRMKALQWGTRACMLRIPGIYALDREGGDPRERVKRGTPVLAPADDVFTNHIHADDLARACVRALWLGRTGRAVNVCDDTSLRMGDYFDAVADLFGLPRPPRLTREAATTALSAMQMSFLSESRRIKNDRLKRELKMVLRYPSFEQGLRTPPLTVVQPSSV